MLLSHLEAEPPSEMRHNLMTGSAAAGAEQAEHSITGNQALMTRGSEACSPTAFYEPLPVTRGQCPTRRWIHLGELVKTETHKHVKKPPWATSCTTLYTFEFRRQFT